MDVKSNEASKQHETCHYFSREDVAQLKQWPAVAALLAWWQLC
jgi:hypothetical protein